MKPAPRALATQLWALKHESPDAKGVTELLHLAASGRTSIPIDKDTPKSLYRTSGYRVAGERAVRVDILERLADLIRPALAWREGVQTPKPDGAFDGRGFTVTGAMTSLTGASGEDFASILRSLGYRMDRRPKPVEPVETKPAEAETKAAELAAEAPASEMPAAEAAPAEAAPDETAAAEPAPPAEAPAPITSSGDLLPTVDLIHPASEAAAPAEPAPAPVVEPAVAEMPAAAASIGEVVPGEEARADEAKPTEPVEAKPAEPAMIEVWRPAGRAERRPHHKPRRPHRPQQTPAVAAAPGEAPAEAVAASTDAPAAAPGAEVPSPPRHERPRQDRQDRKDRHERQQRKDQQTQRGERQDRDGRRDRPRRNRDEGPGRAEREQYYAKPQGGSRANKEPDPNSPFAKLAALKAQLEQKDRP